MAPLTLTIVRHGESTDNIRNVWGGCKDAALTNHGMNQAKAVGAYFADTPIDAVYASPLLRARWTGEQIQKQNKSEPPITFSALLQEQNFGVMEGVSWDNGKGFVREHRRDFAFPEGETLIDVAARADEVIDTFLMPHVMKAAREDEPQHVVVAAHGIFNSELIGAFLRRRVIGAGSGWKSMGMTNTGWTRLTLALANPAHPHPTSPTKPHLSQSNPSSLPAADAPTRPSPHPSQPKLDVQIGQVNITTHLEGVKRQKGGIGSLGHDEKQKSLRDFFAGGGNTSPRKGK